MPVKKNWFCQPFICNFSGLLLISAGFQPQQLYPGAGSICLGRLRRLFWPACTVQPFLAPHYYQRRYCRRFLRWQYSAYLERIFAYTGIYEIVPGFIISALAIYVVSLLDKKPDASIVKDFDVAEAHIQDM